MARRGEFARGDVGRVDETGTMADREQRRWIVALLLPLGTVCVCLCAMFGNAGGAGWTKWLFAPAVFLAPTLVVTLGYLASTSDASSASERVATLPAASSGSSMDREAA